MSTELETLRHSTAHLLAAAVKKMYPGTTLGIGPVIENGFYYDFQFKGEFSVKDFPKIEKVMRGLQAEAIDFVRIEKNIKEASQFAKKLGEPFKVELIKDLEDSGEKQVSFYQTGDFVDLCTGPHVKNSKEIKAFKLLSTASAYWKGDEKKTSLTRIYGTAWNTEAELEKYLELLEQAKNRDHRKIGKELGLFVFSDLIGQGLPLLTAKGAAIRQELERFIVDEELLRGYQHVWTPPIAKTDLYKTSGHYPYFKDSMYPEMKVDNDNLILRPMTCPHHFMLYKSELRSYRELPLRLAEIAPMFRYEKSGELSGLMRVRMFTLADAHIFCIKSQAKKEIAQALDLINFANNCLGLTEGKDFTFRLSLGDRKNSEKYFKDDQAWKEAEEILRQVLTENKKTFTEALGEAAFYGPKIDIQMKNALGKEETAFTVQYDFVMPKRFSLRYITENGAEAEPVVIHRSSIGALERVIAFLLEHYEGKLPFWLSPIQFSIIPIASRHLEYAESVGSSITKTRFRVEINSKNEPMGAKIRNAQLQKVPFMLIVGDKEQAQKQIAVRTLEGKDLGMMPLEKLFSLVADLLPKHS